MSQAKTEKLLKQAVLRCRVEKWIADGVLLLTEEQGCKSTSDWLRKLVERELSKAGLEKENYSAYSQEINGNQV